jgi:hypothetical protein
VKTCSTSTSARCGSRTSATSRSHGQHDQPQELYRQAGPALRKTMNQTIFTKLMLDGAMVAMDELAEPFDVIVPAGRAYDEPTYYRKRPPALTGVVLHEGVSAGDLTLTDLLQLAQGGKGCSNDLVRDRTSGT